MRDCEGLTGSYVYVLVDPRDGVVFYVGKGTNKRFAAHLAEYRAGIVVNALKFARVGQIVAAGLRPKALCLCDGLTHTEAYDLEAAVIVKIGRERLTNHQGGYQSEAMRALVAAKAALDEHFSWDRWNEFRLWSYEKQNLWCRLRDDMKRNVALCEELIAPSVLNSIRA